MNFDEESEMSLSTFVELPVAEQQARGLLFTPKDIAQQPETWLTTLAIFQGASAADLRLST